MAAPPDQIRPVSFELGIAPHASGSVLVVDGKHAGDLRSNDRRNRPALDEGAGRDRRLADGGIFDAALLDDIREKPRDISKGRLDGRSTEIQRLIGRSLRAVVDLEKLGPRTMWVDCDVLQADGGTRTAAITGASLAVAVACRKLVEEQKVAAPPIDQTCRRGECRRA